MEIKSSAQYSVARDGKTIGNFSGKDLKSEIKKGSILVSDHFWTEGMLEWQLVGDSQPVAKKTTPMAQPVSQSKSNAISAPKKQVKVQKHSRNANKRIDPYLMAKARGEGNGGINRIAYFLFTLIGWLVLLPLVLVSNVLGGEAGVLLFGFGVVVDSITILIFVAARMKNIGSSMLWTFLYWVPILGHYIHYKCLAFQEGYTATDKLDRVGKVITFIFVAIWLSMLAATVAIVGSVVASEEDRTLVQMIRESFFGLKGYIEDLITKG